MSDDLDPNDLPAVPDNVDTTDELSKVAASLGDDDDANARKIGSGSSVAAIVVGTAMLGTLGYAAYTFYERDQAYQHREDAWDHAQSAPDVEHFLQEVRADLPN